MKRRGVKKMKFENLSDKAKEILTKSCAYQEGHFCLSSGLHSTGYLQCARILQYPEYAEHIAKELAEKFKSKKPDVVLSPALGGIVWGQELARALGCRAIFAERKGGELKIRRGFYIDEGEKVLLAEDVVTTGGSVLELRKLVDETGGKIIGYTVICDRSSGQFKPSEGMDPWISLSIPTYEPNACPHCIKGEAMTKPGSRWK